jgi:acylphosphatase
MKRQVQVYYSGRVQGVGFRYTTERIAQELGIAGYVRNLDDGRVEVLAEAEEDKLKSLLAQLAASFSRYIKDAQINWEPATGQSRGFNIVF